MDRLRPLSEVMGNRAGQAQRRAEANPQFLEGLARQGRYGDTLVAHITPEEARMLGRMGGAGTMHPETGMPEYFAAGPGPGGSASGGAAGPSGSAAGAPGPGGSASGGAAGPSSGNAGVGSGSGPSGGVGTGQGMGRAGTTPGVDPGASTAALGLGGISPGGPFGARMGAPALGTVRGGAGSTGAAASQHAAATQHGIAADMGDLGVVTNADVISGLVSAVAPTPVSPTIGKAIAEGVGGMISAAGLTGETPADPMGGVDTGGAGIDGARIGSSFRAENPDLFEARVGSTGSRGPDLSGLNTLRALTERYG